MLPVYWYNNGDQKLKKKLSVVTINIYVITRNADFAVNLVVHVRHLFQLLFVFAMLRSHTCMLFHCQVY